LHIAAREGHTDLVKMFIAKECNLELRDEFGYSAAYWAHRHKHADIVALLPPPSKITKEEYYDYMVNQVWPNHPDVMKGGKKKKKKKGKKKK
jgi:ankyrin repeat protein